MAEFDTNRAHPLAGSTFASANVSLSLAPEAKRISLRADSRARTVLSKALGVTLPNKPKTSATEGKRSALWLGPDEWLIYDEAGDPDADLASTKATFSSVDVSHRSTAILVSGPAAADVINAGCPQDLSLDAFPVGACSRTVLGKAEVVLHRTDANSFRIEVWRSFSRYAFDLLQDAARLA